MIFNFVISILFKKENGVGVWVMGGREEMNGLCNNDNQITVKRYGKCYVTVGIICVRVHIHVSFIYHKLRYFT